MPGVKVATTAAMTGLIEQARDTALEAIPIRLRMYPSDKVKGALPSSAENCQLRRCKTWEMFWLCGFCWGVADITVVKLREYCSTPQQNPQSQQFMCKNTFNLCVRTHSLSQIRGVRNESVAIHYERVNGVLYTGYIWGNI